MADGKGCKYMAYSESECASDADWTPQEVYDLRTELAALKSLVRVFLRAIEHVPFRAVDCDQTEVDELRILLLEASHRFCKKPTSTPQVSRKSKKKR